MKRKMLDMTVDKDRTSPLPDVVPSSLPEVADTDQAEQAGNLPAHRDSLASRARGGVKAASSANTRRAYESDWKHFTAWCRRQALSPLPPEPQIVGLLCDGLRVWRCWRR